MTKLGALFLLVASVAWGQARPMTPNLGNPYTSGDKEVVKLKCGKYQHVYHHSGDCGPNCAGVTYDECRDDMHTVTEREWQELIARLKALEYTAILCQKDGKDITCDSEIHKEAHTFEVTIP